MTRKQRLRKLILASASDAAKDLAYYDRKEDEELSRDDFAEAIESGAVTIDEIVAAFRKELEENF